MNLAAKTIVVTGGGRGPAASMAKRLAAKKSRLALAVVWAKEFARYGIRAASIAPGFIGTEMVMAMKLEAREKLTAMILARRVG